MVFIQVAPKGQFQAFRHDQVSGDIFPSRVFERPGRARAFVRARNKVWRVNQQADKFCARDDTGQLL
jgi:hypothetical protein